MSSSEKVTQYIQKQEKWKGLLTQIRKILNKTELKEEVKWGAPTYTLEGKNLIGLAGFKNHMGIWFHQGVFLKDEQNKLMNAQEGKTKALRQWRFEVGATLDTALLSKYIHETIENAKAGKEIKPKRQKKTVTLPPLLKAAFKENTALKKAYNALTPGKQREYAEYIATAKRETTQQSRLQKITPMILEGKGLNDKYKNC